MAPPSGRQVDDGENASLFEDAFWADAHVSRFFYCRWNSPLSSLPLLDQISSRRFIHTWQRTTGKRMPSLPRLAIRLPLSLGVLVALCPVFLVFPEEELTVQVRFEKIDN